MNLLLDTHALLWFLNDEAMLSSEARALIESPSNRKLVSIATCWEIAIKVGLKKLNLGESATTFLPRELSANRFDTLDIGLSHATSVETLPLHHRDPSEPCYESETVQLLKDVEEQARQGNVVWLAKHGKVYEALTAT